MKNDYTNVIREVRTALWDINNTLIDNKIQTTRPVAYRLLENTVIGNYAVLKLIESGNGYFHKWFEEQMGDLDGVETYIYAIVERQDGSIIKVNPNEMQFLDRTERDNDA